MKILNERDIIHILYGATLMAGGGGGALEDGLELVETYKKNFPGKAMGCTLCSVDEMKEDSYTVGLAVMGSPVEGGKVDATNCVVTAYRKAGRLTAMTGRTADYTLSMELGGFNTFTPILISMMEGLPVVDADCAGRAVPGLETAISHINGLPTGPFVMGSIGGDAYIVEPKDGFDAILCQSMAIPVVQMFEQNAGMAGWMYDRAELKDCAPVGTISLCLRIGELIEEQQGAANTQRVTNLFERLNGTGLVRAVCLAEQAPVTKYTPEPGVTGNNDVGFYEAGGYRIHYANESLVLGKVTDEGEEVVATAPDIITMYDSRTGLPLTNEDITLAQERGTLSELRVTLGLIAVDKVWWKRPEKLQGCWQKYFDEIGYKGGIVRF